MPSTESERHSPGQIDQQTPVEDPIDALMEELRGEFKRGLIRRAAQKEAARRKRFKIMVVLLVLAGVLLTAAWIGIARHPLH